MGKRRISRRQFLEGTGTALTVAAAAPGASRAAGHAGIRRAHGDHAHRQRRAPRGSRSRIAGRWSKRCAITSG